jgi:multidrug resistance protein
MLAILLPSAGGACYGARTVAASLVLFVALFALGIDNYIIAAILPQIGGDLGETLATVGLLASAYAGPYALFGPLLGPLSDRYGRKLMLVVGMSCFTAATVGCALAPNFAILFAARLFSGVSGGIVFPAASAYVSETASDSERPRAMSRLLSAYPSSTLLGVPMGAFAAAAVGWRGAFWLVALVSALALVAMMRLSADRARPEEAARYLASLGVPFSNRQSVGALLVVLLWMTAALGNFTYVGAFFQRTYGLPVEQAGLVFVVVGVMGIAATRLGGRFIGVLGPKLAVLSGILAFSVAAFTLPLTVGFLPLSLLVFATWVFGTWFGIPAQWTIISNLHPAARGTMLAFGSSTLYLGGVIGPAVSGRVLEAGGFSLLGPWNAAIGLVALTVAFLVLPSGPVRAEPEAVVAHQG